MGSQPDTIPGNFAEGEGVVVKWLKYSQVLWLGGGDMGPGYQLLALEGVFLTPASSVRRSLGMTLDASLSADPQVAKPINSFHILHALT